MLRMITVMSVLALTIVACSNEVEPVSVSGTEQCVDVAPAGAELSRYECTETLDDERVSGLSTVVVTALDEQVSPVAVEGGFTLANDGGSWSGDWTGVIEDDGTHVFEGVMAGSGGYDGLQYRARWIATNLRDGEVTGTIESSP